MSAISRRKWLKNTALATAASWYVRSARSLHSNLNTVAPETLILNSNENAWSPSQKVQQVITKAMMSCNRYPWTDRSMLKDKLADYYKLPADHVLIGAGSTEILQMTGIVYGLDSGSFISSYPTFPVLMHKGNDFGARWIKVPLTSDHGHDLAAMQAAINDEVRLIYICNPNNPTGRMLDIDAIRSFCQAVPDNVLIFVDEAYMEFSRAGENGSVVSLIEELPNLMVARTFSKIYGLAGLRVGYALAQPQIIQKILKYQIGYAIDVPALSLQAAMTALEDQEFVQYCRKENERCQQTVIAAFDHWGVAYVPSETSFLYFQTDRFRDGLVDKLAAKQVLIRNYQDQPGFARVSMGTHSEIEHFLERIEGLLI